MPARAPLPLPGRPLVACAEGAERCDVVGLWGIVTTCSLLRLEEPVEEWCTRERCWEWGFIPAGWNGRREIVPVRPIPSPALCALPFATCTYASAPWPS